MKRRIVSSALAIGLGLGLVSGGVAIAATPGNIDPDAYGSITVHKYSGPPVDGLANDGTEVTVPKGEDDPNQPLAGVTFSLCEIGDLDVTDPADWAAISALNTAIQEDPKHALPAGTACELVSEKETDSDGIAAWGVGASEGTASSLPLGVYYVTETGAPTSVAEHTLPFLVTVPTPHSSDNSWIYDVNVYPKNALVDIEKEAVDGGAVGVGSAVDWKVTNIVPVVQRAFEAYNLFDLLDARLQYVASSTVLTLDGATLVSGADYFVTAGPKTAATDRQSLRIDFTPDGLAKLDNASGKDIEWSFKTTVLTIGNGIIENDAAVYPNDPTNGWGLGEDPDGPPTPEEPPVPPTTPPTTPPPGEPSEPVSSNWGAVKINKYANSDKTAVLTGAVFQVFGSEADAIACRELVHNTTNKGTLPDTASCTKAVVVTRDASGAVITSMDKFTTDINGTVTIPGLHVGIDADTAQGYWLVEIVPPAGYLNANVSYPVTVTAGTVTAAVTQEVPNAQVPRGTLPNTGAAVRTAMSLSGALLVAGAIALIVAGRRKSQRQV